jgi:hypothetical protein
MPLFAHDALRPAALLSCVLAPLLAFAACPGGPAGGDTTPERRQYALLVGCTAYPLADGSVIRPLKGPENDVSLWERLLTRADGFGFPPAQVTKLVGWPDDADKRPTRTNLVKAFKDLVDKAGPEVRIFILLSGHGTQQPIPEAQEDPLDPNNPEPDGMDEVFLPADARGGNQGFENGLLDNEIGAWLDHMRGKGAVVWVVFDCCHSGTMTRGDDRDAREVSRTVDPGLVFSDQQIDHAVRRAREAVRKAEAEGKKVSDLGPKVKPGGRSAGSLVAFYGAQPFERAPELPLPEGKPHTRENYHGLLSFTLVQALEQRQSPITYRELSKLVTARYRASRGTRDPTPYAEGDLDYEVLGLTKWPGRSSLVLEKVEGKLRVNAGELRGVAPGSVLAVRRPAGAAGDPKEVLGHVRAESASPTTAAVRPVGYARKAAVPADQLPELGRCEVVSRDFGDLRLRLFVGDSAALRGALGKADGEVQAMVNTKVSEAEAEWILRVVSPKQAHGEYGLAGLKEDHVLLLQGSGRMPLTGEEDKKAARRAEDRLLGAGYALPRKVYGKYPVSEEKTLTGSLERDLPKVFKWQNLWRVANGINAQEEGETHGLKLEAARLKDENDRTGGELLSNPVLRNGQDVEFRLKNEGIDDLWVTVLYLNANLGIRQFWAGSLGQGRALKPFRGTMSVKGNSIGVEGLVVFALPLKQGEPDFQFLEQQPLQVEDTVKRNAAGAPGTPFGRLLAASAFNQGTKDIERKVPSTPAVLMQSWILLP